MEMLERCAEVCAVLEEMLEKGSTLLTSDVGCAALLCRAAMESAEIGRASCRERVSLQV